ncbi:MAG: ABC transporter ATP-binding protein [Oscillospiraceae bacterium]|jgi:branched-chain amino acid transport system ATP-binding protein|nr:ABC transporter ATP-binding protein [Oscillospiraceae bacterium]
MSTNVLHVENVTMQFGGVIAVNNLSMDINEGEIVALIGPNGAGKTTAFNCITGVYQPTNGLISFYSAPMVRNHPQGKMKKTYGGKNADMYTSEFAAVDPEQLLSLTEDAKAELLAQEKEAALARDPHAFSSHTLAPTPDHITKLGVARTFQNIRLFPGMTVFDNVLVAKHMRAKHNFLTATFRLSRKEEQRMRDETEVLLKEQGLWDVRSDLATSLPYGQQRRLEIARALATDPKLLLLDEPAAGMNPQETLELASFIHDIRDKYQLTIFLIEHHMDLVMNISDRIYVLDFGSLIAEGTPEEIQGNQRVIDAYLGVADDE